MKFNFFSLPIILITFVLIFSLCVFTPFFSKYGYVATYSTGKYTNFVDIASSELTWPTPGYTTITSYFGYRNAPTSGAGTYHGGIDIGAPTGTNIIASSSGIVTFTDFYGANGFTVKIENNNLTFLYSHVSPNFLVYVGQYVKKGDIIAKVGPKNVYGVPNNPYKDSNGNPTNGATTRCTFTFCNKKRRQSRQSFKLFLITYLRLLRYCNVNSHVHIHHAIHSHLPNLAQLYYYTLDMLFHLLVLRILQLFHCYNKGML